MSQLNNQNTQIDDLRFNAFDILHAIMCGALNDDLASPCANIHNMDGTRTYGWIAYRMGKKKIKMVERTMQRVLFHYSVKVEKRDYYNGLITFDALYVTLTKRNLPYGDLFPK